MGKSCESNYNLPICGTQISKNSKLIIGVRNNRSRKLQSPFEKKLSCLILHVLIQRSSALIECAYLFRMSIESCLRDEVICDSFRFLFCLSLFIRFAVQQNRIEDDCWPNEETCMSLTHVYIFSNLVRINSLLIFLRTKRLRMNIELQHFWLQLVGVQIQIGNDDEKYFRLIYFHFSHCRI